MLYCETFKNFSGNTESILLFGRIHNVKNYSSEIEEQIKISGLEYYCTVQDKEGNQYKIFSNYDPGLVIADTIALLIK